MFTGIVEELGTITAVTAQGEAGTITVSAPAFAGELQHGESIAVNGVCLTVASFDAQGTWTADLMAITRSTTTLGSVAAGDRVNLERAVRADGRLGGHMLLGHADGTGTVVSRESTDEWDDIAVDLPEEVARYAVAKGSIAINGVSLTVAKIAGTQITVSLIPTTLSDTNLGSLAVGDTVNLEADIIGKYVERFVGERA